MLNLIIDWDWHWRLQVLLASCPSSWACWWGPKEHSICKSPHATLSFPLIWRLLSKQFMLLQENYGKKDPASVAKVKNLYKELDLEVRLHSYVDHNGFSRTTMNIIFRIQIDIAHQTLPFTYTVIPSCQFFYQNLTWYPSIHLFCRISCLTCQNNLLAPLMIRTAGFL